MNVECAINNCFLPVLLQLKCATQGTMPRAMQPATKLIIQINKAAVNRVVATGYERRFIAAEV